MAKKSSKGPKRIAGVKVPKRMRKPLGKTGDLIQHPLIADIIAAALISAAAAIRGSTKVRSAAKTAKTKTAGPAGGIGAGATTLATAIAAKAKQGAEAIGEAYDGAGKRGTSGSGRKAAKKKSGKKVKKSAS